MCVCVYIYIYIYILLCSLYFSTGFCFAPVQRELAIQIAEQFEALGSGIGVRCVVVSFKVAPLFLYVFSLDRQEVN